MGLHLTYFCIPIHYLEVFRHMVGARLASGPIASWQIDGETMEIVTGFIFGGSEITADGG